MCRCLESGHACCGPLNRSWVIGCQAAAAQGLQRARTGNMEPALAAFTKNHFAGSDRRAVRTIAETDGLRITYMLQLHFRPAPPTAALPACHGISDFTENIPHLKKHRLRSRLLAH